MARFTSEYFSIDTKTRKISLRAKYRLRAGFQERIGQQIKKGLFKIYLEELERQKGDALNDKYDFITEFARYGLSDYPVLYFERTHGIIAAVTKWMENPELFLDEDYQFKYLVREPSFFELEFLGHVFGIPTSRHWQLAFDNYIKKSEEAKSGFFKSWRLVKKFSDIDLSLSILDNNRR